MNGPGVRRKELALSLEAGVRVPELCLKQKATIGLYAARVDGSWVGLLGAGLVVWHQDAGVVVGAFTIEGSRSTRRESYSSNGRMSHLHDTMLVDWRCRNRDEVRTTYAFKPCPHCATGSLGRG